MRMNQTVVSSMVVGSAQYANDSGRSCAVSGSLSGLSGLGSCSLSATPSIAYRCMRRYQNTARTP